MPVIKVFEVDKWSRSQSKENLMPDMKLKLSIKESEGVYLPKFLPT
jgi:hypothetical protein